jgi:transcriptional regulator with XRE-family HTH domain
LSSLQGGLYGDLVKEPTNVSDEQLIQAILSGPRSKETRKAFAKAVGQNIRVARKAADFSSEGLAETIHVPRTQLSAWENGRSLPDVYSVITLATVLEVTPGFILGFDDKVDDDMGLLASLLPSLRRSEITLTAALKAAEGRAYATGRIYEAIKDMGRDVATALAEKVPLSELEPKDRPIKSKRQPPSAPAARRDASVDGDAIAPDLSRLPEDLRAVIEDLRGQSAAALEAAKAAQATADEALRLHQRRGRGTA